MIPLETMSLAEAIRFSVVCLTLGLSCLLVCVVCLLWLAKVLWS